MAGMVQIRLKGFRVGESDAEPDVVVPIHGIATGVGVGAHQMVSTESTRASISAVGQALGGIGGIPERDGATWFSEETWRLLAAVPSVIRTACPPHHSDGEDEEQRKK